MDTYAADLAAVVDGLGLTDIVVVGHSTGGGEVLRYAVRHGVGRVRKVITVGAVPPVMVASESNPQGTPLSAFELVRYGTLRVYPGASQGIHGDHQQQLGRDLLDFIRN